MRHLFFILFFVLCFSVSGNGQSQKEVNPRVQREFNEAKQLFQQGKNNEAVDKLQHVLQMDNHFAMAHFALADIYHWEKKKDLEAAHLRAGLAVDSVDYPQGFYFLAMLEYQKGVYDTAVVNLKRYFRLSPKKENGARRLLKSAEFASYAVQHPVPFHPENLGPAINTSENEYWPSLNAEANQLVFTRLITVDSTGQSLRFPQEDFYSSHLDSAGWSVAEPLGKPVNTPDNEGAQCISANGDLLFFTACNREDGYGSCDIYFTVKRNGKWMKPLNLMSPVNTRGWESQPSVSADGRYLYFASNRKGGKGKMDIWRAERTSITPSGLPVYGKVTNMEAINTPGNESSPFIHADGKTLYFASDYWPGLGGKDLFVSRNEGDGFSVPENLGYPINTNEDDDGLIVDVTGRNAYFASNREGYGGRDIFHFVLPEELRPDAVSYVAGKVFDAKTSKPLAPVVQIINLQSDSIYEQTRPDAFDGHFLLCLPAGKDYALNVETPGYLFYSEHFDLTKSYEKSKPFQLEIALQPVKAGSVTALRNVFFDTDSSALKPESFLQLKQVLAFMEKNPQWMVEIAGHTDNTGTDVHNLKLSKQRAQAVVSYLEEKGISSQRLVAKGYGATQPVADNTTADGRARNRRTEFRLVKKLEINQQ
ncbi:cell envelope biogenesis protein OmpA [Prolixibacter bellariivorans]|uniref:Cell envelope biogenesis protein OmpA n=1 Tax=Prolixibacter bellariivorans TaxID=314319 RepID=A0A5M4B168_9BACT|nr:OmpA family protein [Prolixibacter bellariivorans]GET33909.1 cell envelope biogenesis protein OmpA [Prolixibacter bellariivorans]